MNQFFTKKSFALLTAVLASASSSVVAHHGAPAHFDMDVELQIEGILTDFQLVNPHGFVYFDGLNAEGGLDPWRCEMGTNLRRFASEETLLPGGRVLVTGNPARREDNVCKLELIEHEDGRTVEFSGRATEGASDYQPSEVLLALDASDRPDLVVIAVSESEASKRIPIEVPTEGFFGHWVAIGDGFIGLAGVGGRNPNPSPIESDLALPTAFAQPAYTAAGQELVESFDQRFDFPALQCQSSVFDGVFHHGNINEFVQESDTKIRWVSGYMDLVRTIHLDQGQHPENSASSVLGHSYGYWEGDSLVVETAGFKKQWLYQIRGADRQYDGQVVSSENLTLRERFTYDEENDQLVVEYVAEDPAYWQEPLSGTYRFGRSDRSYQEYGCIELGGENNLRDNGKTIFD